MVTNLGKDFHRFNRDMVAGVFNQVTNEQGFDHTGNIGNDGVLGQIGGNNQFRADLEKSKKKIGEISITEEFSVNSLQKPMEFLSNKKKALLSGYYF